MEAPTTNWLQSANNGFGLESRWNMTLTLKASHLDRNGAQFVGGSNWQHGRKVTIQEFVRTYRIHETREQLAGVRLRHYEQPREWHTTGLQRQWLVPSWAFQLRQSWWDHVNALSMAQSVAPQLWSWGQHACATEKTVTKARHKTRRKVRTIGRYNYVNWWRDGSGVNVRTHARMARGRRHWLAGTGNNTHCEKLRKLTSRQVKQDQCTPTTSRQLCSTSASVPKGQNLRHTLQNVPFCWGNCHWDSIEILALIT